MNEAQHTTFHNLVGKLPDAGYLRKFFGVNDSLQANPSHFLIVDILITVLWVTLAYPLWLYPVLHGVKVAKRSGISPAWMWFGVHPLFGWITYLIIRAKAPKEEFTGIPSLEAPGLLPVPSRPRSVTIIAVLQLISAVVGLLLGLPLAVGILTGAFHLSEAQRLLYLNPLWRAWNIIVIPPDVIVSIAWIFVSIGLLRLRPAARTAAFWLLAYRIVMRIVLFYVIIKVFWTGPFPPEVLAASQSAKEERFLLFCGSLVTVIGGIIYALVLIVLLKTTRVVDAFRK